MAFEVLLFQISHAEIQCTEGPYIVSFDIQQRQCCSDAGADTSDIGSRAQGANRVHQLNQRVADVAVNAVQIAEIKGYTRHCVFSNKRTQSGAQRWQIFIVNVSGNAEYSIIIDAFDDFPDGIHWIC